MVRPSGHEEQRTALDEPAAVRQRYARREAGLRYSLLNPYALQAVQERERAMVRWIRECGIAPVETRRVLEIGCGYGGNLLDLLRLGFAPENVVGNELLEGRCALARQRLPVGVELICGDATKLELPADSFDVVLQATVFTSILDRAFQQVLAERMWRLVRPGGGVLWYDFVFDNPQNPDVRGVPLGRIKQLFPQGDIRSWRVTLAPPIGRRVTHLHSSLYHVFNLLPLLRTHLLCWIRRRA